MDVPRDFHVLGYATADREIVDGFEPFGSMSMPAPGEGATPSAGPMA